MAEPQRSTLYMSKSACIGASRGRARPHVQRSGASRQYTEYPRHEAKIALPDAPQKARRETPDFALGPVSTIPKNAGPTSTYLSEVASRTIRPNWLHAARA